MEQPQHITDSNAVIDYLSKKLPGSGMDFMNTIIDDLPTISVITKIEVLGFNTAETHYKLLSNFIKDVTVLDLTSNVVDESIEIRKKHKIKLPDAIIAATAIAYNLTLISRNVDDFKNITGLRILNPHTQ